MLCAGATWRDIEGGRCTLGEGTAVQAGVDFLAK